MASQHEKREFESWYRALKANKLNAVQLSVLQALVDEGQATNLEKAAQLLDWQAAIIDADEHMYGY